MCRVSIWGPHLAEIWARIWGLDALPGQLNFVIADLKAQQNKSKILLNKYQSINTFTQKNRNLQDLLFPLPSFVMFCVSEISYIQCIVCVTAVYFDNLPFQYFKRLGEGPISVFLTKLRYSLTCFYMHSCVSTSGYCHCVIFPSCVSAGLSWI